MAQPKLAPLPPDYVRPTAAEFKAAGITHTTYDQFLATHEAELRKYQPVLEPETLAASDEPEPALELAELDAEIAAGDEPTEPWFNPRAPVIEEHELDDTRPMGVAPSAPVGRAALDLTGAEAEEAHRKFFEAYEAGTATETPPSESASGELSPSR